MINDTCGQCGHAHCDCDNDEVEQEPGENGCECPDDPLGFYCLKWGADLVDFDIKPEDRGTMVVRKLIAAIKRISGLESAVLSVATPIGAVQTGEVTLTRANFGVEKTDNTSDEEKPLSLADRESRRLSGIKVIDHRGQLDTISPMAYSTILTETGEIFRHNPTGTVDGITNFATSESAEMGTWRMVTYGVPRNTNLTDAATILVDGRMGGYRTVILNGNRTVANPTGEMAHGTRLIFLFTQGIASLIDTAFQVTWGSKYKFNFTEPEPFLTGGPSAMDRVEFEYNSVTEKLHCLSTINGY